MLYVLIRIASSGGFKRVYSTYHYNREDRKDIFYAWITFAPDSVRFVYGFPYDFSSIVGGYGLLRMCLDCIRAICDFLCGLSAGDGPGQSRTETVQKSYENRAVSARKSYEAGGREEMVR